MQAVFFDLAATLISVRGSLGHQYAAVAHQFGVEADPVAIDRAFPTAFARAGRMVFAHPDAAEAASLEKGFWKEVVRGVFRQLDVLDRFKTGFDTYFDRLFEHFATADAWTVFADVEPTLERLRRVGLMVGLITNFDYRVFRVIGALGLDRLFDSITIPALAGAAKPEAGIFEYALARHDIRPEAATQVGDSIGDDVEGARAAGMNAILLDRKGRYPDFPGPRISSLVELPALLHLR